jgi:hypothetical protein
VLLPQVKRLVLVCAQEVIEVFVNNSLRNGLARRVELIVGHQDGQRLKRRAVGLLRPLARQSPDRVASKGERRRRIVLTGLSEVDIVDQLLDTGIWSCRHFGGRNLHRCNGRIPGPVVHVVLVETGSVKRR